MNKKVFALYSYMRVMLTCLTVAILLTSCNSNTIYSDKTDSFTFIQICDPQLGFSDYNQDRDSLTQAVRQINKLSPDFVVICGDMVNTANDKSFSDFKEIVSSFQVPCYYVPGNHDIGNKPTSESLQYYRKTLGDDYFVFEHKGTAFIFVNTQLWKEPVRGESEKHDIWLKERLKIASEKGQQVFIVGHYPLFCKEADEADEYMNLPLEKRRELLRLFDQNNVIAVLSGHTHRLILNNYKDIQMVSAETISKNFDERPLGFRMWYATEHRFPRHEFIPLDVPVP